MLKNSLRLLPYVRYSSTSVCSIPSKKAELLDLTETLNIRICKILTLNILGVRNYRVTKSKYDIELRKKTSHFELLT